MEGMEEELIFILVPKSKWANYIVHLCCVTDSGEFYSYKGRYAESGMLDKEFGDILKLCDRLETSSLYERFGKRKYKNERDFADKASGEILHAVKSFVDKTIADILFRIFACGGALFLRESRLQSIYKADRIRLEEMPLKPLLGFFRDNEKIRYTLRLSDGKEELIPSECGLKVITDSPGMVLIGNTLFRLPEKFSGLRLIPFQNKKEVIIPRQNERDYFRKFILKNVYRSEIEMEGFDVIEPSYVKRCTLSLERSVLSEPLFSLEFYYNQTSVRFSDTKRVIVELKEEGDEYCFYKIKRDTEWEQSKIVALEKCGLKQAISGFFVPEKGLDWAAAVEWIADCTKELKREEIEILQDKLPVSFYTGNWEVSYSERKELDWFQLHIEVVLENGRIISMQEMRECILSGKREFMLDDHTIFIIPEEWFSRYTGVFLFGQRKRNGILLHRNQFALVGMKEAAISKNADFAEIVQLPGKLKANLREYQLKGYEWLYWLYRQGAGACLADDMGLGKTVQTIAMLLKYKEENPKKIAPVSCGQLDLFTDIPENTGKEFRTCLIIAPASVVHNWKNELVKFAPSLSTLIYTGSGSLRSEKRKALMCWDTVVTTYQTFRNDAEFFTRNRFGIVVFDESQYFKNRSSQLHQAVSQIQGEFYIALSGTPIENSLSDLWSLMEVINRNLLGTHSSFQNYFIRPITLNNQGIHSEMLHKLVAPYILRRTKEEVLHDLPERMDEIVLCEPDKEQKQVYEEELSRTRNLIMEKNMLSNKGGSQIVILQSLNRLRQIANHPKLAISGYNDGSGKFREIFRMLEEINGTGHKVLLFSDYVSFLEVIAEEMSLRCWKYAMLTGETRNREEVINRFSFTPKCHFFLISLKAGGVGLNLTDADYVFILDPWWNVAAEEQAISRAHRMGQKRSVFVYRFITEGTLEEKILTMQKDKQDLVDIVLRIGL